MAAGLVQLKNGMRFTVILAALLHAIGTGIRCFSVFNPQSTFSLVIVCIGQIFNAIAGPLIGATPSLLSARWFPAYQRTTGMMTKMEKKGFLASIKKILIKENSLNQ